MAKSTTTTNVIRKAILQKRLLVAATRETTTTTDAGGHSAESVSFYTTDCRILVTSTNITGLDQLLSAFEDSSKDFITIVGMSFSITMISIGR
jgi:hypothetical protein